MNAQHDSTKEIARIYTEGWLYEQYRALQNSGLRPNEQPLIDTYCPDRTARICNVGCGEGRESFALYRLGYRQIMGVDCTPAMLNLARERAAREGFDIRFTLGTVENLPYQNEAFDVVTLFANLLGHITPESARRRALQEIRRVLRPGGLVLMNANSLYHRWMYFIVIKTAEIIHAFYNPCDMERGDKRFRGEGLFSKRRGDHVARSHWFRPPEVPACAREAGLSVVLATTSRGLLRNPKSNSARLHRQGDLIYVLQRPR